MKVKAAQEIRGTRKGSVVRIPAGTTGKVVDIKDCFGKILVYWADAERSNAFLGVTWDGIGKTTAHASCHDLLYTH
jgi:hypothetical protein